MLSPGVPVTMLPCKNLSRIHDVCRVKRPLDLPHHIDGVSQFGLEKIDFSCTDAVLAGTGTLRGYCAPHHPVVQFTGFVDLDRIFGVDQNQQMEIAIADVSDYAYGQSGTVNIPTRFSYAFSEI